MSKLIVLTADNDLPVIWNLDHIARFCRTDDDGKSRGGNTIIVDGDAGQFDVKETLEEIAAMLSLSLPKPKRVRR